MPSETSLQTPDRKQKTNCRRYSPNTLAPRYKCEHKCQTDRHQRKTGVCRQQATSTAGTKSTNLAAARSATDRDRRAIPACQTTENTRLRQTPCDTACHTTQLAAISEKIMFYFHPKTKLRPRPHTLVAAISAQQYPLERLQDAAIPAIGVQFPRSHPLYRPS